ncbi:MAG: methyl-accepting chemotaxis protein [Spirochaetaceae bacterium]|nr:methyl-accepting chemotaxis protein [Spirochaetaceae bacterium]
MKTIRIKILLVVVLILIVASGAQSFFSYKRFKDTLNTTVTETLDIVSSKAEQQIIDLNNKHFSILRALAQVSYCKDPNTTPLQKHNMIADAKNLDPATYVSIAFYDKEGFFFNADYNTRMDFSDMEYVKQGLKGKEFVSDPVIFRKEDLAGRAEDGQTIDQDSEAQVLLFYSEPVYNTNNEIEGVIVAIVNGACFANIVRGIDMGDGHHPVIVSRTTGQIFGIAKNENETYVNMRELFLQEEFEPLKADLMAGQRNRVTTKYPGTDKSTIIGYVPIPGTTWSLLAAVPYHFYFGDLATLLNFSILCLILSIIIASLVLIPLIRAIVRPLKIVSQSINQIASGNADLTKRIEVESQDEVGRVVEGFNNFSNKLQNILQSIKNSQSELEDVGSAMDSSTQDTSASITQIIANIESVHRQILTQDESVQQTAGAVNEIASNIASLEKLIVNQSNRVTGASAAIEQMMGNIESVNRSVDKMASSFDKLLMDTQTGSAKQADVSQKVEQIVAQSKMLQEANLVISNIATQTNLLAMNAAIEAAHAGESGKGFSVVADEIRKLSETSTTQSKTIGVQLNNIRNSIEEVVLASADSNGAFVSVSQAIKQTDEVVRLIKSAMEEQSVGSQQIYQALHEMNDSTAEVRTAGHEMAEGNKHILEEVKNLQDSTMQMKQSMGEMSVGAERINMTGAGLKDISAKLKDTISQIGDEVRLFKV